MRVCSGHFHSGRPAYEKLDSDPDWVPSLHLGHDEGESTHTKHLLESECRKTKRPAADSGSLPQLETREDCVVHLSKAAELSWREVKSMLQSLLKVTPNFNQKPGEEEHGGPVAETTDISFRDFFKGALEGALEASIRSRAQSKNRSSSEFKVKLNFEPLGGEPVTSQGSCSRSSSSSPTSCLNCVRLQRRIQELEQELFRLAVDKTKVSEAAFKTNQALQNHEEDQVQFELMEHPTPGQVALCTELQCYDDKVEGLDSRSSSSSPKGFNTRSKSSTSSSPDVSDLVQHQRQSKLRFREEWLSLFPFLRYSPSLMWCHVCRIHADVYHRNLALITGSRDFKKNSIEKHSNSNYHQESLRRHVLRSGASQL